MGEWEPKGEHKTKNMYFQGDFPMAGIVLNR